MSTMRFIVIILLIHLYYIYCAILRVGNPLRWNQALPHLDYVRTHGVKQFSNQYLRLKNIETPLFFWGDEVESIQKVDPNTGKSISNEDYIKIYPANLFVTSKETIDIALKEIEDDLEKQINFFEKEGRFSEAKRIKERTEFD